MGLRHGYHPENKRFKRSGPQITNLLLRHAKISSKTSRVGSGVQGKSSR